MAIPDVSIIVPDFQLGISADSIGGTVALIGVSQTGTPLTVYQATTPDQVKTALTAGPLAEAAAFVLEHGGGPVLLCPVTQTTPGAAGAVAQTGTGPAMTVAGAAYDAYDLIVQIVQPGAVGTSTFRWSRDGGDNYSAEIATAATYPVPGTNLTLTFPSGTYVAGTSYESVTTAPYYTLSDMGAAVDALLADPRTFAMLYVVGVAGGGNDAAKATATVTVATAVGSKLASAMTNQHQFIRGFVEMPDVADAALLTAFVTFADTRVVACAGYGEYISSLSGFVDKRSSAYSAVSRAAQAKLSENIGRQASGALPGLVRLWRDEQVTQGLDAGRFLTLRTYQGEAGFYITQDRLMAPQGSDFKHLSYGRVLDEACRVTYSEMLHYLNDNLEVDKTTGFINEAQARSIETRVLSALSAAITHPQYASNVTFTVNRTDNLISTENLRGKVQVTPRPNVSTVTVEVGLYNPARSQAVAA